MSLLDDFLTAQRKSLASYSDGLLSAISYVTINKGEVIELGEGETKLVLGHEEAICFKPYEDIDLFYFEI
jgi:hypothetical protein